MGINIWQTIYSLEVKNISKAAKAISGFMLHLPNSFNHGKKATTFLSSICLFLFFTQNPNLHAQLRKQI